MDRDRPALTARWAWAIAAIPILFLGIFFLWPVASIVFTGLTGDGKSLPDVLGDRDLMAVAWFTLWQAVASTALTLMVAMPAAWVFARFEFPGKRTIRAVATVPFVLPTIVVATAFLALLGPSGALGIDLSGSIVAILAAHVFFNHAVVVRTVGGLWAHLDPRLEEAARSLGAGRWRTFTAVTLPLLRPAIAAASSIIFLFTFTSFGVVLLLGGPGLETLEVEIWRQTTIVGDLSAAAVLAVLQLVGVTAILLAYSRYQDRSGIEQRLVAARARPPRSRGEKWSVAAVLGSMLLLLGAPLIVLVERSLRTAGGYGFDSYTSLDSVQRGSTRFVEPWHAIGSSLRFAVWAAAIALVVGLAAATVVAYRRSRASAWFDALLMLPLGTSAVTIGFGFLVALDWPVDLRASAALVPIAHSLVAIPFVVRSVAPVMRSIRTDLREAAAVLGAAPAAVWRTVDLPIVSRATGAAAGFALAVSLGEFGATAFVARPETATMPVAIFRLLGLPGNFGRAMAMSVILMAVTASAILAVERLRVPGQEAF